LESNNIAEDTDATNELINDGQFVQPLTLGEIETLKQSGVHASVQTPTLKSIFRVMVIHSEAGHYQETDRAARKLFSKNGIQQGKVQKA
jgi:hypothetical protein